MELNTLPDEMITIILKRISFKTLLNMRKMNERIDRIARRAGLSKMVPVESLEFSAYGAIVVLPETAAADLNVNRTVLKMEPDVTKTRYNHIEKWISRVKIYKTLSISNSFSNTNGKFDVMEMFGNKFAENLRNLIDIKLYGFTFHQPLGSVVLSLCESCPRVEKLELSESDFVDNGLVIWDEKLLNWKWKSFQVTNQTNPLKSMVVDDKFLSDVVAFCDKCEIHTVRNNFTISGVMNLLNKLVLGYGLWHSITLCSMVPMNIPRDELKSALTTEIPEVQVFESYNQAYTILYMTDTRMIEINISVPFHI